MKNNKCDPYQLCVVFVHISSDGEGRPEPLDELDEEGGINGGGVRHQICRGRGQGQSPELLVTAQLVTVETVAQQTQQMHLK